MASDWYQARLKARQGLEVEHQKRMIANLEAFLRRPEYEKEGERLHLGERLHAARIRLQTVSSPEYVNDLLGTLGADPFELDRV
ncbi:MAG TPA: hypothetical protein PKE55_09605 [Kiritimatiellia bacterium]|nr:hypothetical protein [Kiritimatiellia bacterium]